jgi:hypothetical protein
MKKLMKNVFFATALFALTATGAAAKDYSCKVYQNATKVQAIPFAASATKDDCIKAVKDNILSIVAQFGGGSYQVTYGHKDGLQPIVKKYKVKGASRIPASVQGPRRDPAAVAKLKKEIADQYENINTYRSEIEWYEKNIADLSAKLKQMQ